MAEPVRVASACPLDCPDACSLEVTVADGRVVKVDGARVATRSPTATSAPRCATSREHLYGADRVAPPAAAGRSQGRGALRAALLGRGARPRRREAGRGARPARRRGDPAVLLRRLERLAVAGHDRRAPLPAARRLAARAHGLRRADRTRGDRPLRQDGGRRLRRLRARAADRGLGHATRRPPASTSCRSLQARPRARREARRDRPARARRSPGRPTCTSRCVRAPTSSLALAVIRWLFESGRADRDFLARTRPGADELRRRAAAWTLERAARGRRRRPPTTSSRFAELYAESSPAVIRCGWGARAQPQRRLGGGGDPRAAGGGREVRRARRRLHADRTPAPGSSTRRAVAGPEAADARRST